MNIVEYFIVFSYILIKDYKYVNNEKPRVCIIGAGVAGLSLTYHFLRAGISFKVFESTEYVGGTWRYDSRVGVDENGLPLHTSMYHKLRTNLPKQTMELHNFSMPEDVPAFPTGHEYYDYIKAFASHFDLYKHINFLHEVTRVDRETDYWLVKYKNIKTGEVFEEQFDYIMVAAGHYSVPSYPNIPGEDIFKGTKMHSHDFRKSSPFKGRRVLVIGTGPSGLDIGIDVVDVSSKLIHSHHVKIKYTTPYPENYIQKPDVKELTATGAIFEDGTFEEIDDIIYCTGYKYYYPFLSENSGLDMPGDYIKPLHHYVVNINQPTLMLFGLVVKVCVVKAIDAQARYATALIKGDFKLPPKDEMMKKWQRRYDTLVSQKRKLHEIHLLAEKEDDYYAELTAESRIDRVPPVLFKIRINCTEEILRNFYTFRNFEYTIIDNNTFTRRYVEPRQSSGNESDNEVH